MAYSRWSNSDWYTYWSSESVEDKDDQLLAIYPRICDGTGHYSYDDLTHSLDQNNFNHINGFLKASEKSKLELIGIIKEFIEDVDSEMPNQQP